MAMVPGLNGSISASMEPCLGWHTCQRGINAGSSKRLQHTQAKAYSIHKKKPTAHTSESNTLHPLLYWQQNPTPTEQQQRLR
jgi:hypothetical protein